MTKQSRRILVEDASLRVPSGAASHRHRIEREEADHRSSIVVPDSRFSSPVGPGIARLLPVIALESLGFLFLYLHLNLYLSLFYPSLFSA